MKSNIIQSGAEAILIERDGQLIKRRIKKGYRIKEIDDKLRKLRTRKEGKILERAGKVISCPKVIKIDDKDMEIVMEFIDGKKLSRELNNFELKEQKEICKKIGQEVAKLHELDIIHGDLTTSNMILREGKVYLIDFGLGFENGKIEDKAVDLHLIKQALEAKHFEHHKELYKKILEGYEEYKDSKKVLVQLEKVELRGRYKNH